MSQSEPGVGRAKWYSPEYPYKEDTRLLHILRDGWARGFEISQTWHECQMMGYSRVTVKLIERVWAHEDRKFDRFVERQRTARAAAMFEFNC